MTARAFAGARWLAGLVVLALPLGWATSAAAQADVAAKREVAVVVIGHSHEAELLDEVVTGLLAQYPVSPRFTHQASLDMREIVQQRDTEPNLLARAWFDVRSARRAKLLLEDPASQRVLVREVPLERGLDEIAREELAHILEAAVETLLAGGSVGRPRAEVVAALALAEAPLPPSAPPVTPAATLAFFAYWEAQTLSAQPVVTQGPGVSLVATLGSGAARPAVRASLRYRLPLDVSRGTVGAQLDTAAAQLVAGLDARLGKRLRLWAGAGGGVDATHISPELLGPVTTLDPSRWSAVPFAEAVVTIGMRLTERSRLEVGVLADWALLHEEYTAHHVGQADETVFDPWRIRPALIAGLTFE